MSRSYKQVLWWLSILTVFDIYLWFLIFSSAPVKLSTYYFLDIGQGDSTFLIFPGNVKLLVDGGPDGKIMDRLAEILPPHDRYIDLMLMTHPQQDHIGGFPEVLKGYKIGAFLGNGRAAPIGSYGELMRKIKSADVPYIGLTSGDRIRYGEAIIEVLSPDKKNLMSPELNDTSLVLMVRDAGIKTLLTGDIGSRTESELARRHDLDADILKVGHHGSRFSSSATFLAEVTPQVSVIEVGKNRYGHPTPSVLARLAAAGSLIYRTDRDGTVAISVGNGKLSIFKKS
jgi:competence protein ComEC